MFSLEMYGFTVQVFQARGSLKTGGGQQGITKGCQRGRPGQNLVRRLDTARVACSINTPNQICQASSDSRRAETPGGSQPGRARTGTKPRHAFANSTMTPNPPIGELSSYMAQDASTNSIWAQPGIIDIFGWISVNKEPVQWLWFKMKCGTQYCTLVYGSKTRACVTLAENFELLPNHAEDTVPEHM